MMSGKTVEVFSWKEQGYNVDYAGYFFHFSLLFFVSTTAVSPLDSSH